ncbi:hypothetical protein BSKO_08915 [Bryopsis sp. KO-2023]|nr:hypothetical protein BSKO_08915 [Bryopsis sp. KO-2023]
MPFNHEMLDAGEVDALTSPLLDRHSLLVTPLAELIDEGHGTSGVVEISEAGMVAGEGLSFGRKPEEKASIPSECGREIAPRRGGVGERSMYCLARVDDETGLPVRRATLQEAEELGRILALSGNQHLLSGMGSLAKVGKRANSLTPARHVASTAKGGGPCDHCAATESPQWRRGPPSKPVLCNACGTRFRRTGQLSPPQQAPGGKSRQQQQMEKRRWDRKDGREARLVYCEAS